MNTAALFDIARPGTLAAGAGEAALASLPRVRVLPSGAPKVVGLDLSLSGTGIAGPGWADTIKTRTRRKRELRVDFEHLRFDYILQRIDEYLSGVALAVIEDLALGPGMDIDRQLAYLNWEVRRHLYRREIPYALVRPNILKLYAVGKASRSRKEIAADKAAGRTVKTSTLAQVQEWFPWFIGDDNAADAVILAAMGADRLGKPLVTVPDRNRAALNNIDWPENLYV